MDYNILRENDIRGEYPTQINGKVGKRVAEAFAVYLNDLGVKKCMLGHDNRISSEEIYKEINIRLGTWCGTLCRIGLLRP